MFKFVCLLIILNFAIHPVSAMAQGASATTTLTLSICGNNIVDDNEECDVPGETGVYSTTIVGRQCNTQCRFGPYCGDGILQTQFAEECDDGNNDSLDFCSALCKIEPAGAGGGGTAGGGAGGGGGSPRQLGETQISIVGHGYPAQTINILLDTRLVGSVRTTTAGRFEFTTPASPGTASLGFWSLDNNNTRSITLNTTFDVTQGAITNITGIILPPTIRLSAQNVNPSDQVTVSGQAVPNATIEVIVGNNELTQATTSNALGNWSVVLDTTRLRVAEHTIRARSITGNPPLRAQSNFSTALQLFVGVDGRPTTASDLNRDTRVNLIDFSILIFWWGTDGGDSDPPADINGNGRVGIEDFSILLFNWTG